MSDDRFAAQDAGDAQEDLNNSLDASPAPPEDSLDLRDETTTRSREAAEARDRHLRTLADFDNYRKRVARDREDWRRHAQEQLLREILPVLDNFDRALAAEPGPAGEPRARDRGRATPRT